MLLGLDRLTRFRLVTANVRGYGLLGVNSAITMLLFRASGSVMLLTVLFRRSYNGSIRAITRMYQCDDNQRSVTNGFLLIRGGLRLEAILLAISVSIAHT